MHALKDLHEEMEKLFFQAYRMGVEEAYQRGYDDGQKATAIRKSKAERHREHTLWAAGTLVIPIGEIEHLSGEIIDEHHRLLSKLLHPDVNKDIPYAYQQAVNVARDYLRTVLKGEV